MVERPGFEPFLLAPNQACCHYTRCSMCAPPLLQIPHVVTQGFGYGRAIRLDCHAKKFHVHTWPSLFVLFHSGWRNLLPGCFALRFSAEFAPFCPAGPAGAPCTLERILNVLPGSHRCASNRMGWRGVGGPVRLPQFYFAAGAAVRSRTGVPWNVLLRFLQCSTS